MSDHQIPTADSRSARRRLLKGSFAVPAAFTLASGTAFAAGSAGIRCVKNSADADVMPPPGPSDTLIRVQAYITGSGSSGNNGYTFVRGQDIFNKLGGSTGTLNIVTLNGTLTSTEAPSTVLCVVGENGNSPTRVLANTLVTPVPTTATALANVFYAVLIDANGNIIGISSVTSTMIGGAVSNLCWASFKGNT